MSERIGGSPPEGKRFSANRLNTPPTPEQGFDSEFVRLFQKEYIDGTPRGAVRRYGLLRRIPEGHIYIGHGNPQYIQELRKRDPNVIEIPGPDYDPTGELLPVDENPLARKIHPRKPRSSPVQRAQNIPHEKKPSAGEFATELAFWEWLGLHLGLLGGEN